MKTLAGHLHDCIRVVTTHCPNDDMDARLSLGVLDVIARSMGDAGVTDIHDLRKRIGIKEKSKKKTVDPKPALDEWEEAMK